MKKPEICYNHLEDLIKDQTHLQIKNIEMNVQIEAKLAFFTVRETSQFDFYWTRQDLQIYRQIILHCNQLPTTDGVVQ